jgi:hypothetical protein
MEAWMIDRERLAASRKAFLRSYWMIAAMPLALVALGWWVASAGGDGASTTAPRTFGILTAATLALGVAVLLGVPLLRARWRGAASPSPATSTTLSGGLMSHLFIELALWEALAMFGFTAAFAGEPLAVLFGACLVSLGGILYTYPRWSAWEDAADAADRCAGQGSAV